MSETSWGGERELSTEMVARLIEEQFPQLSPVKAVFLDEGWEFQVFEVDGAWLFRFPKRDVGDRALAVEHALAPELAPRLGVPIPTFELLGKPGARYPHHFVGYRKLSGLSANHVDTTRVAIGGVAPQLGEVLTQLHAFPVDDARRLGVPEDAGSRAPERLREDAISRLNIARRSAADSLLRGCLTLLDQTPPPSPLAPRLAHGDLTAEHILVNPGNDRITGIVDWADLRIGDAAIDFAGLFHWLGEPLVRATLDHYRGEIDNELIDRARYIAVCMGLQDIAYGVETGRAEYEVSGRRALENALGATRSRR